MWNLRKTEEEEEKKKKPAYSFREETVGCQKWIVGNKIGKWYQKVHNCSYI